MTTFERSTYAREINIPTVLSSDSVKETKTGYDDRHEGINARRLAPNLPRLELESLIPPFFDLFPGSNTMESHSRARYSAVRGQTPRTRDFLRGRP